MSEIDDKNRNTRIKQQKNSLIRNILICVAILLVFTVVFWVVSRNSSGTEISYNEFQTQLDAGNIKEIDLNQSRIQVIYVSGESHRRTMISGLMPRPRSSLTECWVGLDLCSPLARRYGTSVTWM